jgi:Type IV pilin-like G and H, putative
MIGKLDDLKFSPKILMQERRSWFCLILAIGLGGCAAPPSVTPTATSSPSAAVPATTAPASLTTPQGQAGQAKAYISAINRGQQAIFLETNQFAGSIEGIGLGLKAESEAYTYRVVPQADPKRSVANLAIAKGAGESFLGLVYVVVDRSGEKLSIVQICSTSQPLTTVPTLGAAPQKESDQIVCPDGFTAI